MLKHLAAQTCPSDFSIIEKELQQLFAGSFSVTRIFDAIGSRGRIRYLICSDAGA
jgi:hypothetical protein